MTREYLRPTVRCALHQGLLWLGNHDARGPKSGPLLGPFLIRLRALSIYY